MFRWEDEYKRQDWCDFCKNAGSENCENCFFAGIPSNYKTAPVIFNETEAQRNDD